MSESPLTAAPASPEVSPTPILSMSRALCAPRRSWNRRWFTVVSCVWITQAKAPLASPGTGHKNGYDRICAVSQSTGSWHVLVHADFSFRYPDALVHKPAFLLLRKRSD